MPGQIFPNYEAPTGNLQGTPVSPQAPSDGNILIYSGPANTYIPGDPIVSGPDPVGNTPSSNPVQIGGEGPNQTVTEIQTDTTGKLEIDTTLLLDIFQQILFELRAIKNVLISMDNTLLPQDFESSNYIDIATKNA